MLISRRLKRPVGLVAVLWICFLTIAVSLPELNPVNSQTLNYTPGELFLFILLRCISPLTRWISQSRDWDCSDLRLWILVPVGEEVVQGTAQRGACGARARSRSPEHASPHGPHERGEGTT